MLAYFISQKILNVTCYATKAWSGGLAWTISIRSALMFKSQKEAEIFIGEIKLAQIKEVDLEIEEFHQEFLRSNKVTNENN